MTRPVINDPADEAGAPPKRIVIGLGNRFRQDDAAGLVVACRLRERVPHTVTVVEHDGDPLDLLPLWTGQDLAILIDALNVPGEAGKIRRFDPDVDLPPNRESIVSSHGHSLWDACELASLLRSQPGRTLIFAIAGERFGYGEQLSPEVEHAVDAVLSRILTTLSEFE